MNNSKCSPSIAMELWPHYPHSCVLIWLVPGDKPLDKGAGIVSSIECEGKKQLNTPDHHALHTALLCIYLDKDGVTPSVLIAPIRIRANPFLIHATHATDVTGCKKSDDR
jgi:hypothetical protein